MRGEPSGEKAYSSAGAASTRLMARLLYVEDNPHIAEITLLMLEDFGLDIIQTGSAEEALKLIGDAENPPCDIVLTDVVMPGLSGVQFARRLNQRWPSLPVVLVSGFSDELALGYGSQYELLRKPFTRGALLESLQRHLDRRQSVSA